ncbi:SCO6745 family protein [Amycolatopsis pigmentata]|uniref:MarR family transcriptional regulator n=1 Tax=Amycolatopsis pigmentata TaxID=450801 RepID=A0ABW5FM35_9PSEU
MLLTDPVRPRPLVDLDAVREVSRAVSDAHLFIYLVREARTMAAELGVTARGPAYLAFRAAALGAVPWQVVLATFYNFSPQWVRSMTGVWDAAAPERWQSARFAVAARALRRVGVELTADRIAEARSLVDPVVAAADYAGKPLAAANASVALPPDPLVALWQQITVVREWRGDAHFLVLAANRVGPCECNVLHTATGRLPVGVVRATRGWTDEEWDAATARLTARGWLHADGTVTEAGLAARERIEVETDEHCADFWAPIGAQKARRFAALIAPIHDAFAAAGTFDQLR